MVSTTMQAGTAALFRQGSFVCFLLSRSLSRFSSQIAAVAIGWQIYDLTASAFLLGMVGLVQFLPTAFLVFVAGMRPTDISASGSCSFASFSKR